MSYMYLLAWKDYEYLIYSLKVIHVHRNLRNMFITLVWNVQQSFHLHHFHIIVLPVLFCVCQISMHCFIIEL